MADITLQQLSDELPVGSITFNAGAVTINLNALTGDAALATSAGIAETLHKLLYGAQQAQVTYNADVANVTKLSAYPPVFTSGVTVVDGEQGLSYTHTVNVRAPLSTDNMKAVV